MNAEERRELAYAPASVARGRLKGTPARIERGSPTRRRQDAAKRLARWATARAEDLGRVAVIEIREACTLDMDAVRFPFEVASGPEWARIRIVDAKSSTPPAGWVWWAIGTLRLNGWPELGWYRIPEEVGR